MTAKLPALSQAARSPSQRGRGARRSQAGGFTLVETTMALGIVSFALVALLGMLPIGLQTSRAAMDLTLTTQIGQRLIGMIEQTGYSSYGTLTASYYYFDDQGQPLVPSAAGVPPANALYAANIVVSAPPAGNTPSLLAADVTANTVAWLQINIVNDPGHVQHGTPAATVPPNLSSRCTVVPVFLANNGG